MTCLWYPFVSVLQQGVHECYKQFTKMNKKARFQFLSNSVRKIRMARAYILKEKIDNSELFDKNIPWPQDLYVTIVPQMHLKNTLLFDITYLMDHILITVFSSQRPWSWWQDRTRISTQSPKERSASWTDWFWPVWFALPRLRLGRRIFLYHVALCFVICPCQLQSLDIMSYSEKGK